MSDSLGEAYITLLIKDMTGQGIAKAKADVITAVKEIENANVSSSKKIQGEDNVATKAQLRNVKMLEDIERLSTSKKQQHLDSINKSYSDASAYVRKSYADQNKSTEELNAKLGALSKEQKARTDQAIKGYDRHSVSFMTATKNILKAAPAFAVATAAIGAVYTVLGALRDEFIRGLSAVEDYRVAVASMAGFLVSFTGGVTEDNISKIYTAATEEAKKLVTTIEILDARTIATGKELTSMTQQFIAGGIQMDLANKETADGFINISNALKLLTKGQNQEIQMRQETRALVQGTVRDTNVLMATLKLIDPEIKEHLKTWKEQGTTIKNVGYLLRGLGLATQDLEKTWAVVGSKMETIHTKILRGAFEETYDRLIAKATEWNDALMDADGNLTPLGLKMQKMVKYAIDFAEALAKTILLAASLALIVGVITGNPWVIGAALIAGFAAATVALDVLMEKMKGIGPKLWDNFKKFDIGELFTASFDLAFNIIKASFVTFMNVLKADLADILNGLASATEKIPFGRGDSAASAMRGTADEFKNSITPLDEYTKKIEESSTKIKKMVGALFSLKKEIEAVKGGVDQGWKNALMGAGYSEEQATAMAMRTSQLSDDTKELIVGITKETVAMQKKAEVYGKTSLEMAEYNLTVGEYAGLLDEIREKANAPGISGDASKALTEMADSIELEYKKAAALEDSQKANEELARSYQSTLDQLLPLEVEQREYNEALAILDKMDPTHTTDRYATALANLEASLSTAGDAQKDLTQITADYHEALLASLPEEESAVMRVTEAYDQQRAAVTAALEENVITAMEAAQVMSGLNKQQEIETKAVTDSLIEQAEAINTEADATTAAAEVHAKSITDMMRSYRQLNAGMTEHQIEIDNLTAEIADAIIAGQEMGMTESELTEIRQAGIQMTRLAIDEQNKAASDMAESFLQANVGMTDFQIEQDRLKQSVFDAADTAYKAGATWGTLNRIIEGGNIMLARAAAAHRQYIEDTLNPYRQINSGMSELEITLDNITNSTDAAIRAGRELGMTERELAEIRQAGGISAQRARDEAAADAAKEADRVSREASDAAEELAQALREQTEATIAAREAAYATYLSSREIMTRIRQLDMTDYGRSRSSLQDEFIDMGNQPGISQDEQSEIFRALGRELKKLAEEHTESVSDMLIPYRQINAGMSDFEIKLADIVEATDDAVRAGKALGLSESELNEIRAAGVVLTKNAREEEKKAAAEKAEEDRSKLLDKLQSAYDRESEIFKSTIDQFDSFSDSLKSFRDNLKSGDLSTLSSEEKYFSAKADFTDISTRAQLGDVEAIEKLESSASAFLEASQGYNASGAAYVVDFNAVTAALDATIGLSDRQSDIAQLQLDKLTSQVEVLLKLNESVESVADILRAIQTGGTVLNKLNPIPKFADGGYHAGGLRLVGEKGPELEYTAPSRIINADTTRNMLSGGSDTETKVLLQQILVELKADKVQRGAVGQITIKRLEKVADKLDKQGRAMDRKVA